MNRNVVKRKSDGTEFDGRLYEIQYVVHSACGNDAEDVYACYRLSNYDGMPIGPLVWVAKGELEETDVTRLDAGAVPNALKAREEAAR